MVAMNSVAVVSDTIEQWNSKVFCGVGVLGFESSLRNVKLEPSSVASRADAREMNCSA
jgi:hypothetical protein